MAEALEAAGLTHVRYGAGEEVPWDPGLFLLDVESGEVEGWVRSLAALAEEERSAVRRTGHDFDVSPSNRFLSLPGVLYDRQTGRAYRVDGDPAGWWGFNSDERLLFRDPGGDAFVVVDSDLEPLARISIPPGELFISPAGGYILVHEGGLSRRFHLLNLEDEAHPRLHTWDLPWEPLGEPGSAYRIELLDNLVVFVGSGGHSACHVTRYDLGGVLLSDQTIPCPPTWLAAWGSAGLPRISPDGRLLAAVTFDSPVDFSYGRLPVGAVLSIFDAATGEETARILGVHPPWVQEGWGGDPDRGVWLADSSGVIVQTLHSWRDGWRVARLDGTWGSAPGWPSPDDPELFLGDAWGRAFAAVNRVAAVNQHGDEQASLPFGPPSAAIPGPEFEAALIIREIADWGARSDTLRVRTSYFHTQSGPDYDGTPPLDPVIELAPFDDRLLVEVVVDTCLNVREEPYIDQPEPWPDAPVVTCLPNGTVAETDDFEQVWSWPDIEGIHAERHTWMHIRTTDGVEGWARGDYLRWHSDGARLGEMPDSPAASAELDALPAGWDDVANNDSEKLVLPSCPVDLTYDTYDTTGMVATAGSYAFLMEGEDGTMTAVTTYEALRDGTATMLRIHTSDAGGASQADFYNDVDVGDLLEWRQATDCWVRYRLTSTPTGATGAARDLGVERFAYAFTGCRGKIATDRAHRIGWNPPVIATRATGSREVTLISTPIRYGPYLLYPPAWSDRVLVDEIVPFVEMYATHPALSSRALSQEWPTSDLDEVRQHPFWRDPVLPDGWSLGGQEAYSAISLSAVYGNDEHTVIVHIGWSPYGPYRYAVGSGVPGLNVAEATTIGGYPAMLWYDPTGALDIPVNQVSVIDDAGVEYRITGYTGIPIETMIAIARSLLQGEPGE